MEEKNSAKAKHQQHAEHSRNSRMEKSKVRQKKRSVNPKFTLKLFYRRKDELAIQKIKEDEDKRRMAKKKNIISL